MFRITRIARRSRSGLILAAALVAVGCGNLGSGGSGGSGGSDESASHQVLPPLVEQITAIPPDVPATAPSCASSQTLALTNNNAVMPDPVRAKLRSLESTCANPSGHSPEIMVIYNLTDGVLDVSPANGTSPVIVPKYPAPSGPLPSWDKLEIDEQNSVVRQAQRPGKYLVPVGGEALVFLNAAGPPLDVNVRVDAANSAKSYAAQLITGYVTDNLLDKVSALSYEASIADCVNGAQSLWQDLSQRAAAATTMLDALRTVPACQDLASKVREDRAEELAAAGASDATGDALKADISKVADTADADGWEAEIEELIEAGTEIVEGIR